MNHHQINYLALGDSLTVGIGATRKGGFVREYTSLTEATMLRRIMTKNISKKRLTSAELVRLLNYPHLKSAIFEANIITISIGGNDLIQANRQFLTNHNQNSFHFALHSLSVNLQFILQSIAEIKKNNSQSYMIRVIGLYNPYPELPYSHYWVNAFNKKMSEITSKYGKFVYLHSIFARLGDSVLSFDILHPNFYGYQVIAAELYRTGYHELI